MLFNSQADRLVQRIYEWWHFSFFNRIDLLILLVGIIGIVLRLIPGQFINAKTCYAVNCVLLFIRLLRDYSASSYLGPKLVMITKMVSLGEVLVFIDIDPQNSVCWGTYGSYLRRDAKRKLKI